MPLCFLGFDIFPETICTKEKLCITICEPDPDSLPSGALFCTG